MAVLRLLVLCLLLAGCGESASSGEPAATPQRTARPVAAPRAGGATRWQHVVWIVMENKAYDTALDPAQAPYTRSLGDEFGLADDYHAITHPSLPNYLAMTSGSTHGVEDDDPPADHPLPGPSIFSQVGDWRALQESMGAACAQEPSGRYAVKHNPAAYFTGLRAACMARDTPLGPTPDLSARFTFITPDMCNDTHDCGVSTGDEWLRRMVPRLLASPEYRAGRTVIFLTWDENDGSAGNRIPTIVISPKTRGRRSTTAFTHYSLLRTTEELLGLPPLGAAATAPSMRSAFGL